MQKVFYKLAAGTGAAILFSALMTGTALVADLEISGNGDDSTNKIEVTQESCCTVVQTSETHVWVGVSASASTGGNEANGNTGRDVEIRTGDIFFDFLIENGPINVGGITWGCCPNGDGDGDGGPPPPPPGDGDGDGDGDGAGPGPSAAGAPGAGGYVLALAETSGEGYPVILFGLAMIALGASLVKKQKFV